MRPLKAPDNRLFIGKGGSGKSTLARHQAAGFPRVLIHDPNCEAENAEGAQVCDTMADLVARLQIAGRGPFRICWRGYTHYFEEVGADGKAITREGLFEFANKAARAAEDCLIIWEELDTFTRARGGLPPVALWIAHAGRHRGLRTMALTRSPYMIPRDYTRNVTRISAFRVSEPRDLKWLGEFREMPVDTLPALPDFECIDWTDDGATRRRSPFT